MANTSRLHKVKDEVDPIKFLESQHREVESLFERIEKMGDKAIKSKAELFGELAHKIECHAQIEEKVLYPAGKELDKDMTLEAYEEHALVRELIQKISRTSPTDEVFMARVTVLKELIEHHVEEEEQEYFPKFRKNLDQDELLELGIELREEFAALDKKVPRRFPELKVAAIRKVH